MNNTNKVSNEAVVAAVGAALELTQHEIEKIYKKVDEKVDELRGMVDQATKDLPVLSIKVGDASAVKLSGVASEYLPFLVQYASLGYNVLLMGPAGCGKTTLARQLSEAFKRPFGHICLTAGASETWLFGRQTANGFIEGEFSKLYRNGGVFLADEIDAADANLLLSLNTALSSKSMYNPILGETVERHADFIFVAAANTNGMGADEQYTGRNRLDAATLDRFIVLPIDYSDTIEKSICPEKKILKQVKATRKALVKGKFKEILTTRMVEKLATLHKNKVSWDDTLKAVFFNWSDTAKELLNTLAEDVKTSEELPL